tara:strand:+ start:1760 stop:2032 length:273 start_codon:yes stop_codon:yes gene_type:complete
MFKKITNTIFLIASFSFVFLISKHYFSEQNVIYINKSRTSYSSAFENEIDNLPTLKNDTENIIVYINDLEKFKKNRKKRFWEKLISNDNE